MSFYRTNLLSTELRRKEVFSDVGDLASILYLQAGKVDLLMQRWPVVISEDQQLTVGELIDKSVDEFPKCSDEECDVSRVESEQPATVALWHHLDDTLHFVLGDLSSSDIWHVTDASPGFNFAGNHTLWDHVIKEKVRHVHELSEVRPRVNNAAHVHDDDRVLLDVSLKTVEDAWLQKRPKRLWLQLSDLFWPRVVFNDFVISLLVVPLQALQKSQQNAVSIIVFRRDFQSFNF